MPPVPLGLSHPVLVHALPNLSPVLHGHSPSTDLVPIVSQEKSGRNSFQPGDSRDGVLRAVSSDGLWCWRPAGFGTVSEAVRAHGQSSPCCLTGEAWFWFQPVPLSSWPQSPCPRRLGQWSLRASCPVGQWLWLRGEAWGRGVWCGGMWEVASPRGSLQRDPRVKIAQVIFSCLGGGI